MSRQGKQRALQTRRAARKDPPPVSRAQKLWPIPAEEDWDHSSGSFAYHVSATVRIVERIGRLDGRLVFYAIMLECASAGGDWTNVWRIDCRHDSVHRHTFADGMKSREVIRPISGQDDVESTYEASLREVEERWPEIERGWRDGRPYRA